MSYKQFFEERGYVYIPNMILNPEELYCPVPLVRGTYNYGSIDQYVYDAVEKQVEGSLSRYNYPPFKDLHFLVKNEVENILDMKLYPTYYYDRFYFVDQELERHTDRPACEISVTLQISTNREEPWDIWFNDFKSENANVSMNNGDACIYRGCNLLHWRKPLESKYTKFQNYYRRLKKLDDDTYHHQVFFHYVDADGPCLQHAYDQAR